MPSKNTKSKNIKLVEEAETTETATEPAAETQATTTSPNRGEIIDVEWKDVKQIFDFKNQLADLEQYFANMCLHFEKEKANIITQITYGQNDLYMMAQQLQKTLNVDDELTYELKLPTESGQKGFFVRKDD
tara:strand:- start:495 stop:887 length:393 start_codon:yes stop_codon:yes gene_type:complete